MLRPLFLHRDCVSLSRSVSASSSFLPILFFIKSSESAFFSFFLFSFSSLSSFSLFLLFLPFLWFAEVVSFGQGTAKTIKVGRVVAVLAIRTLISSVLLSHICTCFGLCNSLGGHICGDSYEG